MVTMTRGERTKFLQGGFALSPRWAAIKESLLSSEYSLFLEEYERIHSELDSLTAAEEQMLTTGILSYVLALRAQKSYREDEELIGLIRAGQAPPNQDRDKVLGRGEAYRKEYTDRMRDYRDVMESLKATRDKRLEKIYDQKRTLIDLITELSKKDIKQSMIDDVYRLDKMTDEELTRLLKGEVENDQQFPYLIGDVTEPIRAIELTEENLKFLQKNLQDTNFNKICNQIIYDYFTKQNNDISRHPRTETNIPSQNS